MCDARRNESIENEMRFSLQLLVLLGISRQMIKAPLDRAYSGLKASGHEVEGLVDDGFVGKVSGSRRARTRHALGVILQILRFLCI